MKRAITALLLAAIIVVGVPRTADAAGISVTLAQLNAGQLLLEGSGAVPGRAITADGTAVGSADANGAFKVQVQPFTSATCVLNVGDGFSSASAALAGCTPATPGTTAGPQLTLTGLTLSPNPVAAGNTVTGTVTLSPAPSVDTTLPLSLCDFTSTSCGAVWATAPASVTVPAGSTTGSFTVKSGCAPNQGCGVAGSPPPFPVVVGVEAAFSSFTQSASLVVLPSPPPPPALGGLSVNTTSLTGGGTVQASVSLVVPSPTGPVTSPALSVTVVGLSSSNPAVASVPASVTVPFGTAVANFLVMTSPVTASTPVTISATSGGVTKTVTLTLAPLPATPPGMTLTTLPIPTPGSFAGGFFPTPGVQVDLSAPPAIATDVLSVTSSDPAVASVPASVLIGAGNARVNFSVETHCLVRQPPCVGNPPPVTVTITVSYAGVTQSVPLTIGPNPNVPAPAQLAGLSLFNPAPVGGSDCCQQASGNITLTSGNYPAPTFVTVRSSNPAVAAIVASTANPVRISVVGFAPPCCNNPNPTSAGFVILTKQVPAATAVTISASYNGTTQSLPLTVLPQDPPPTLAGVAADQASPVGGSFLAVTTTLSGLPQNNGSVALSSSNPAAVPVPATASFGWGAQSIKTLVQTQPVTAATAVTITASLNGTTASTVVTVLPGLTLSPATVTGGAASQGTVVLTSPLCCNNVLVSLFSSNPAVASAPASVTIRSSVHNRSERAWLRLSRPRS